MSERLAKFQYPFDPKEKTSAMDEAAATLFAIGTMQIREGDHIVEVRCQEKKSQKGTSLFSIQCGRIVEDSTGQWHVNIMSGSIGVSPQAAVDGLRLRMRSLIYDQIRTQTETSA